MKEPTKMNSYYAATATELPLSGALEGNHSADVCIVGGGITGLSAAWHLAKSGMKVILLESNRLSWAASGRNGGFMVPSMDHSPEDLEGRVGASEAREFWALSEQTIDYMRDIIAKNDIECGLKQGVVFAANTPKHAQHLVEGARQWQDRYDADYLDTFDKDEIATHLGTHCYHGGVLNRRIPTLHPLRFTLGIARLAIAEGVEIHENTRVVGYEDRGGKVVVRTESGAIVTAGKLLLAVNAYLGNLESKLAGRFLPVYSAMAATEVLTAAQVESTMKLDCGVLESSGLGRYYRLSDDNRLVIGGGGTFTSRNCEKSKIICEKMLRDLFPQLTGVRMEYSWGGWFGFTSKGDAPDIGRLSDNIHYAQAIPVTWATLHGKLLTEELSGGSDSYQLLASMDVKGIPFGSVMRLPVQMLSESIGFIKAGLFPA